MKDDFNPIKLRRKTMKDGRQSLYLDFCHNGQRSYEFLRLYIIPERTQRDKEINKTTMIQAESHRAKRLIEYQNGIYGVVQHSKINRVRLAQYIRERYEKSANLAKNTKRQGITIAKRVQEYDDPILQNVTKQWIKDFLQHLRETLTSSNESRESGRIQVSERTIHQYYTILSIALNRAQRDGLINANPCKAIDRADIPANKGNERVYLTFDELQKLINTPMRSQIKPAFLFSCFTGLRWSDLQRLKHSDIKNGTIEIKQTKTKSVVRIPLTENARKWIPKPKNGSPFVFWLLPQQTGERVNKWAQRAGIESKRVTFHSARHTFATLLLTSGADIYTTSKLLGHASVKTTEIYAKITDKKREQAVNLIPTFGDSDNSSENGQE